MEENVYAPPNSPLKDLEQSSQAVSWGLTLRVWWSFVWRSAVYGFLGGIALGGFVGAIAGATGHLGQVPLLGALIGYLVGVALSIPALKQALQKHQVALAAGSGNLNRG